MKLSLITFFLLSTLCQSLCLAADSDLPTRVTQDAIMASPDEVVALREWVSGAFERADAPADTGHPRLTVLRQDHNTLHFNESCLETPLQIGGRKFDRGLGTHANSEIRVEIPAGATAFKAFVGVDNNYDTAGARGSVQFSALLDGAKIFETETLRGGHEPVPVNLPVPAGAKELILKVDATADGPGFDQADWADARFVVGGGRDLWLGQNRGFRLLRNAGPPFSFIYGGKPSRDFIHDWKRSALAGDSEVGSTWEDPLTGLAVTARAVTFPSYGAVEWVVEIENRGNQDTPILEQILAADVEFDTGNSKRAVTIRRLQGDSCSQSSFTPMEENLACEQSRTISPQRGRPSQETAFPFWNMTYRDHGVITAIGWSGQWSATHQRRASGVTHFRAGMEKTHLVLHPGEKLRTPRVLIMPWQGELRAAHNRFRRLMLFEQVPKQNGRPLRLPIALQTFDRYISRPDWATEAGQLRAVEAAHRAGFDTYWFDAGWFVGGFPKGVGNWFCKPAEFPNGLKPIGDLCHRYGMQFIVWFEPCRVAPGTQVAREHPQFVLGGTNGGLFNLGDPAARRWMTDLISTRIEEFGVDVYREDFNIDPLEFWRKNDTTNRQGITEIRFVEGHYAFWDELRARHPGLWIDNCASGGRRIDLETCKRSVPLWRSDTSCSPGHPEWNQQQTMALSEYLPLHTASAWELDRYTYRSSATGGILCEMDYLNPDFSFPKANGLLDEVRSLRKYWYGDFYPATPAGSAADQFAAFQLHRPDLQAGCVVAFRRPGCNLKGIVLELHGLAPKRVYTFESTDENGIRRAKKVTGAEVQAEGLELRIPSPGQSLVVTYH